MQMRLLNYIDPYKDESQTCSSYRSIQGAVGGVYYANEVSRTIAVATTEADEAIASSDFLKIMGISPPKKSQLG